MANPLHNLSPLPRFDLLKPEHVVPGIKHLLEKLEADFSDFERELTPTWDDAVNNLHDICEPLGEAWGVVNHLMGVRNSDALRVGHQEVQPQVVRAFMRISQSEKVYQALVKLRDGDQWNELDDAQRRIIEHRIVDAELSGIALRGKERRRFNEIEERLSELQTDFSNHVLDATKAYSSTLTDVHDVAGMPESWLRLSCEAAKIEGHEDATWEAGPWRLTLDHPSYLPFLRHSQNRDLREKLYRAQITKAASGDLDNSTLISEILKLRKEQANLLGYATFADVSLKTKMAEDTKAVRELLDELRNKSLQQAEKELNDLRALWAEGLPGTEPDKELKPWDIEFLSELLRQRRFEFTDEDTRPYFPLPRVLDGLFALVRDLFGIEVKPADGQAPIWNADVRYFKIFDSNENAIASFFLDPYSRPKNKRGGAWMDECKSRQNRGGASTIRLPVAYLVCNQTPPVGDKPALMTFHEVETLFHEFGHGLQHMLTKVDYAQASGINGVEWDAVELPSQFMENWCYHRETLLGMSEHIDTGERIPDALFEKIRGARTFRAASAMLRQIYFSRLDLSLHCEYDASGEKSPFELQMETADATLVFPPLPDDRFLCSFSHIFAGGYSAGYYSYKWAELLSADAFGAFEDAGLDKRAEVIKMGRRFRDTVLACGGAKHPMDVFVDFRGRQPTTEALLRHADLLPGDEVHP